MSDDLISRQAVIDLMTKEISERIIQFLEENYEIIPKKPVVRCKDCKYFAWFDDEKVDRWCGIWANKTSEDCFCSYGERRKT